jgi:hypothetical protein
MTTMTSTNFSRIRLAVLSATGAICLTYAVLALVWQVPDPIWPWLPILFGFASVAIIAVSARLAGARNAHIASDELFRAEWHRAMQVGYWVALALYPIFALLLVNNLTDYQIAFAAMATLTGSAPLLAFFWLDVRGS